MGHHGPLAGGSACDFFFTGPTQANKQSVPGEPRVSSFRDPASKATVQPQAPNERRLAKMKAVETRDGVGRVLTAALPILIVLGVFLLVRPPPGTGAAAGGLVLGMASMMALVRWSSLSRESDPNLAVAVATGTAIALVALSSALLFVSGEPAAASGLALIVVATGIFILSVRAVLAVAVAAHVGFIAVVLHHGGNSGWTLAAAGLVVSVLLAGLAHHRQVHVLKATVRLAERETRHNEQLENAFMKARDAELDAKRLAESASAGIQAQREREALRARMQSILDSAGEGIVGTDRDGRVVFVNEAASRLTGHLPGQMVGESLHALVHHSHENEDPYPWQECPVREVIHKQLVREVEGEAFWHKDGSSFPVAYVASPLVEEGKVQGAVVVFQDVSQQVEIERMKDELVSVVSHELRTPLTSIHGSLKLIMGTMGGELPQKARRLVDIASRNSERLTRLVNDLLDLERLRAGRFEMEMHPVDTHSLANEVVQGLEAYARSHDARLVVEGEPTKIIADPHRLHQALVNLVSNAIKFSPPGATVRVVLEHNQDRVWFSVIDEGPGIARDKQKLLFERFSQLHVRDASEKGGSGLGLAITRGIVEAHGGSVGLMSEPGQGSTFYLMLPRGPDAETPDALHDATNAPSRARSVDDRPDAQPTDHQTYK